MSLRRRPKLLLLGGTGDARRIATDLVKTGDFDVIASLAGVTRDPSSYPCATRAGGFGGPDGLAGFLRNQQIDLMIDATHPFAAQMSQHTVVASATTGCPVLRIERSSWTERLRREAGWSGPQHATFEAAANDLPSGAHAFLAVGRKELAAFADRTDVVRYARTIEKLPTSLLNAGLHSIVARPPFSEADERALFSQLAITHLVTKDAGGDLGWTKLRAAIALDITISLVTRPVPRLRPQGANLTIHLSADDVLSIVRRLLQAKTKATL